MSTEKIIQILFGLLTAISIALAAFALKWVFVANADIKSINTTIDLTFTKMNEILEIKFADIEDSLVTLADDTDDITRITEQLQKHWKLHNWAKDQIAELRHKEALPPVSWPDFN